jgi:hypothetical protein
MCFLFLLTVALLQLSCCSGAAVNMDQHHAQVRGMESLSIKVNSQKMAFEYDASTIKFVELEEGGLHRKRSNAMHVAEAEQMFNAQFGGNLNGMFNTHHGESQGDRAAAEYSLIQEAQRESTMCDTPRPCEKGQNSTKEAPCTEKAAAAVKEEEDAVKEALGALEELNAMNAVDEMAAPGFLLPSKRDRNVPAFWKENYANFVAGLKPKLATQACVQLDFNFAAAGVPIIVSLGLSGELKFDFNSHCFGWSLEVGVGITLGFEVFGKKIGISLSVTGTLSLKEVPYDQTRDSTTAKPYGSDKNTDKCHSTSPFSSMLGFMDNLYTKLKGSPAVQKMLMRFGGSGPTDVDKLRAKFNDYKTILPDGIKTINLYDKQAKMNLEMEKAKTFRVVQIQCTHMCFTKGWTSLTDSTVMVQDLLELKEEAAGMDTMNDAKALVKCKQRFLESAQTDCGDGEGKLSAWTGRIQDRTKVSAFKWAEVPSLKKPASAMFTAYTMFEDKVPRLAAQVMERLVDNDRAGDVLDAHMEDCTGQYLARVVTQRPPPEDPSSDAAKKKRAGQTDKERLAQAKKDREELAGTRVDGQVQNFARCVRDSKHSQKAHFWKVRLYCTRSYVNGLQYYYNLCDNIYKLTIVVPNTNLVCNFHRM